MASPWAWASPPSRPGICPASAAPTWPTPTICWPRSAATSIATAQTLNVTSRTSGFVPGAPFVRHFLLNDYDIYGQDQCKLRRTLTLTLGLRWELPGTLNERDSLELAPVLQGTAVQTLLSNATLNFAGSSVGRPFYNRQWKDFAPNFGFAWDVFGDGKTAFRGGYSISYVNDQEILAPENMLEGNGGLQGYAYNSGLTGRVCHQSPRHRASHLPGPPHRRRQLRHRSR